LTAAKVHKSEREDVGTSSTTRREIESLTNAVSNEKSITINRIHDVTTVTTFGRVTGKATTETFIGDSPYGR
jgi:hypothetical protein